MNRQAKLKQLDDHKAAKNMVIITDGEPFIKALENKLDSLKNILGVGIEVNNLDDLVDELGLIESFKTEVSELRRAIEAIDVPNNVKVDGLNALVAVTKQLANKKAEDIKFPKPVDVKPVIEAIDKLSDRIDKQTVPEAGQLPADFTPVRRVMRVANTLVFDDSHYNGGSGGGSGVAPPSVLYQPISQSGAGTTNLVGAVSGKRIKVTNYAVVLGGAGTVQFKSDTNSITGAMSFAANGGVSVGGTEYSPAFQTGVGEALNIVTTSAAGNGHIAYFFE